MDENLRIREIRKHFGLSMESFGSRVGVGKTAISKIENSERGVTEQMRKSICREFKVNEDWLRDGKGEMFVPDPQDELDALCNAYGLSDRSRAFIREFAKMNEKEREIILKYVESVAAALRKESAAETQQEVKTAAEMTDDDIEDAGERMKEQLRKEKKAGEEPSASNTTA